VRVRNIGRFFFPNHMGKSSLLMRFPLRSGRFIGRFPAKRRQVLAMCRRALLMPVLSRKPVRFAAVRRRFSGEVARYRVPDKHWFCCYAVLVTTQ